MTAIERVIARARAEIGYLEKATNSQLESKTANAGYNNFNKYARDLDALGVVYNYPKNGYSWCDIFYDWLFIKEFGLETAMKMLYQDYNGLGAGCYYSSRYYRAHNAYFYEPQIGDQIFFLDGDGDESHTGIVVDIKGDRVYTIEGNTSSASGVVDNGGCVAEKSYHYMYSRIGGYGRPNWSLVDEPEKEDEEMTEEIFEKFNSEHEKKVAEKPGSSWSQESRDWAVATGLIKGAGKDERGNPIYMWQSDITREAMVEVLYRLTQKLGIALK